MVLWLHHFGGHLHDLHNFRERNVCALVGFLHRGLGRRFEIAVRLRGFRQLEAAHLDSRGSRNLEVLHQRQIFIS